MRTRTARPAAFSLVEVTLALGIAAFALLAIFGLLPVGINSNQASVQQTAAANLATEILADLRLVPSAAAVAAHSTALSATSPRYGLNAAGGGSTTLYLDESGTRLATAQGARYKAVVTLVQPTPAPVQPAAAPRSATTGSIVISWPPAATNPLGNVTVFVALDRN